MGEGAIYHFLFRCSGNVDHSHRNRLRILPSCSFVTVDFCPVDNL